MNEGKPVVIENRALYRTLAIVALPIALQSLIASSLTLVDNLMVGSLGEVYLAAVGVATQLFLIHWGVLFGFCSGCSTFMAQFWGAGDLKSIRKVTGFSVTCCMGIGIIFFIPAMFFPVQVLSLFTDIPEAIEMGIGYMRTAAFCFITLAITVPFTTVLRATQQTMTPLKISLASFGTNTLLNYIFIFGKFGAPALGVTGAAVGTMASRALEMILILYVVFGRKNKVAGSLKEFFDWDKSIVKRVMRNAAPTTINEAAWFAGTAAYNAAYGRIGVTAFAAIQASGTINSLFTMAMFSLGDAALILVGQRIGRGEMDYAFELSRRLRRISVMVGATAGIMLILSSRLIIKLFEFTPEGRGFALHIIMIYGIFMAFKLHNGVHIVGFFRAGGDVKFSMYTEMFSIWFIGVPMVFLGALVLQLPVYFVVLMAQAEEITKFFVCRARFRSKKWVNSVIHGLGTEEGKR